MTALNIRKTSYQKDVSPDDIRQFRALRAEHHSEKIRHVLKESGFDEYETIRFSTGSSKAVPLTVITGANVEGFDPIKHKLTETKSLIELDGQHYVLNQSVAMLPQMVEQTNHIVLALVKPGKLELFTKLFEKHVKAQRVTFFEVATDSKDLLPSFYAEASKISNSFEISTVHMVLYESFAAGMSQPFKAIYEEDVEVVSNAVSKRARFFHQMSLCAYDLLLKVPSKSLRIVAMTALAARRVGGNLLADAAHKQISTNYLETLAKEVAFHLPEYKLSCVEVAPGVVDNGIYDDMAARVATLERAAINNFDFDNPMGLSDDITAMPKLSPNDIAHITMRYVKEEAGKQFHEELSEDMQKLAYAGIYNQPGSVVDIEGDSIRLSSKLPQWFYNSGAEIGRFPAVKEQGYQFVPISPEGQYF